MKLKKIKSKALSEARLKDKVMGALKGDVCCTCSCYWEGKPGSFSSDNSRTNYNFGYESIEGCNEFVYCDEPNEAVPLPTSCI